jgi:hypothetical protein
MESHCKDTVNADGNNAYDVLSEDLVMLFVRSMRS